MPIVDRPQLSTDGLLGFDRKDPIERAARRDHAKVGVEHDERLAHGVDDVGGIGPRGFDCAFRRLCLGDVGEGDDHTLDAVVLGTIGQYTPDVPSPFAGLYLTAEGRRARQHRSRVGEEITVIGKPCEVGEWPADVGVDDAEE